MRLKGLLEYDIVNYKKPSMTLSFSKCDFKCGKKNCQNSELIGIPSIEIDPKAIIQKYTSNPLVKALVCSGMEPFDTFQDLATILDAFREVSEDDIVIYTGYEADEIEVQVSLLTATISNILIKFGRYEPNSESYFNEDLGVTLASSNQHTIWYGRKLDEN